MSRPNKMPPAEETNADATGVTARGVRRGVTVAAPGTADVAGDATATVLAVGVWMATTVGRRGVLVAAGAGAVLSGVAVGGSGVLVPAGVVVGVGVGGTAVLVAVGG